MPSFSETNLLGNIDQDEATSHELKAVQAARMSTFAIALLTTILTIFTQ